MKVIYVLVFGRPASPRKWWRRVAPAGPKNTVFGGSKNVARVRKCIETRKLKAENANGNWLDTRTYKWHGAQAPTRREPQVGGRGKREMKVLREG